MKKLFIVFGIVFFVSTNSLIAKTVMVLPNIISQYELDIIQSDIDVITNHFGEENLKIESLFHFDYEPEKQCTVTITAKFDGKVISVTFVVEGKTCEEYIRDGMK